MAWQLHPCTVNSQNTMCSNMILLLQYIKYICLEDCLSCPLSLPPPAVCVCVCAEFTHFLL